jgi:tetratricopeptide (TPR) repeat protein
MSNIALPLQIQKAIEYYNIANQLFQQKNINEAVNFYKQALLLNTAYFEALFNVGVCLNILGNYDEARENFEKALEIKPDEPSVLYELGYNRQLLNRHAVSIPFYERAILLQPNNQTCLLNLGVAYYKIKQYDLSEQAFQKVITINPNNVNALYNYSKTLIEKKQHDTAKKLLLQAIELAPNFSHAYINLGNILYDIDKDIDNALKNFEIALEIDKASKNNLDLIYYNIGNCHRNKLDNLKAINNYNQAIQINPEMVEAHWNLSLAYLANNNIEEGFKEYLWRWKRPNTFSLHIAKPLWNGEDISDKILLVHAEQGFGDSLMFVRYLKKIRPLSKKIILAANWELLDLFKNFEDIDEIMPRDHVNNNLDKFDCYTPLLNLPTILKTNENSIPVNIPYLFPDEELVKKYHNFFEPYKDMFKIGFAWKTNPKSEYSLQKSCEFGDFSSLFSHKEKKFFSLQREFKILPEDHDNCINLADELISFANTAAILEHLDLVITVDTALCHLSASMGKPTWTIIPYHHDWRWGVDGTKSPWYPDMKLFRQKNFKEWEDVFQRINEELSNLTTA